MAKFSHNYLKLLVQICKKDSFRSARRNREIAQTIYIQSAGNRKTKGRNSIDMIDC